MVLFGIVLVAISGFVGSSYGFSALFREDPAWVVHLIESNQKQQAIFLPVWISEYGGLPRILHGTARQGQTAAVLLIGCLFAATLFLEEHKGRVRVSKSLRGFLAYLAMPTILLSSLPFVAFLFPLDPDIPKPKGDDILFALVGQFVGWCWFVLLVTVSHYFSKWANLPRIHTFILVFIVFVSYAFFWPKTVPAVSIIELYGVLSVFYLLAMLVPSAYRILTIFVSILVIVALSNNFKLRLDGITNETGTDFYENPVQLARLAEPTFSGAIPTLSALEAWKARVMPFSEPGQKPKLVVVTTSGGAYRAAFWTALLMDKLSEESADSASDLAHFIKHIRLISGSSGGMVAGAYFAALQNRDSDPDQLRVLDRLLGDIESFQKPKDGESRRHLGSNWPVRGDSLSPVIQQFMQRDVAYPFYRGSLSTDRGKVLERQWQTLMTPFASLRKGEAEGWRSSVIVSPMIVETGQQLLISNLDLSDLVSSPLLNRSPSASRADLSNEFVDFFGIFPGSEKTFQLATAVRMSASFPYISPVVELPTKPAIRFVDAGYYDNYGVATPVAWLRVPEVRDWVLENTGGVVLLQIRAHPELPLIGKTRREGNRPDIAVKGLTCTIFEHSSLDEESFFARALQWITTPLEGAVSARERSMLYRNNRMLANLKADYDKAANRSFFHSIVLENQALTSLNWYVPSYELDCMKKYLELSWQSGSTTRVGQQWKKLKSIWKSKGP